MRAGRLTIARSLLPAVLTLVLETFQTGRRCFDQRPVRREVFVAQQAVVARTGITWSKNEKSYALDQPSRDRGSESR